MLKINGKNAVKKGEVIFQEGDELKQIGLFSLGKYSCREKM